MIFQVLSAEQLTEELAALRPDYLYVPLEVLYKDPDAIEPFTEKGTGVAAVLPRIITDDQVPEVAKMLQAVRQDGVDQALVGNLGHIFLAKQAGFRIRGDFGLNAFNSYALDVLRMAGLESATASFELRLAQIRDLKKPIDAEMIVYGRLPAMVSDQCIIKNSAGRCSCQTPGQLSDRTGSVFPVVREFGCRNVIYNAH